MLTILFVYAPNGFPLLLSVDVTLDERDPARWCWCVGDQIFPAIVGLA